MTKLNKRGKPFYVRKGEKVGGGFFVFRRGTHGNRVKPSNLPFEHPSYESALAELERLKVIHPYQKFVILSEVV